MLIAALHAMRDTLFVDQGTAPPVEGGSTPLVRGARPSSWARRRRATPGVVGALLINGVAVVAFMILWHHSAKDLAASEGIPVEVVDRIPGEGKAATAAAAPPEAKPAEKPDAPPQAPASAPPKDDPAAALRAALDLPTAPPTPAPALPPTPTPAPNPTAPTPPTPAPAPPAPAPVERPMAKDDAPPRSAMAEPPPEPKAAVTQSAPDDKPNAAEQADKAPTPEAPPPPAPAPAVITAPQAETTVPTPSQAPDKPARETAGTPAPDHSAEATASLSAALPMSSFSMPSTFRSVLSAQGTSSSQQYKGVVFGSLSRATQAVSAEARRRRLKGQVVVMVSLDPNGGIEKTAILQSSGSADVDALALDLVRRAAPFPPPPPGTPRSFTPVISIGDDS